MAPQVLNVTPMSPFAHSIVDTCQREILDMQSIESIDLKSHTDMAFEAIARRYGRWALSIGIHDIDDGNLIINL